MAETSDIPEMKTCKTKAEKPPRVLKTIKCWSENKQKWFYKASPEYYRQFYHKKKCEQTCSHCGSVITSQLSHHLAGKKCTMQREMNALKDQLSKLTINQ